MILYTLPTTGGNGDASIEDKISDRRQSGGGDDFKNVPGDQIGMLIHTINQLCTCICNKSHSGVQVRMTLWM